MNNLFNNIPMKSGIYILAILILLSGCNNDKKQQIARLKEQREKIDIQIKELEKQVASQTPDSLNADKFRFVSVEEIKPLPFDHYIRVQGKLDGDQNVTVHAEAPGTIKEIFAHTGQQVSKGQLLARIDDEQYRKQLESLETQYNFATEMYEKQKRLWDQKVGSEIQYLQAKTTKESLEQQISSVKEQIKKFSIHATINGTIAECNIKTGSVVSPDPRLIVFRIVAFNDLKVTAEVSEAYSARVTQGDNISLYFPDLNQKIDAKVDFVSQYISQVNRTFLIESKITRPVPNLKANMITVVEINDYHTDNAVVVPVNLIQNDQKGAYVYIVKEKDKYHAAYKQYLKTGMSYNGLSEVVDGLKDGDKIVKAGFQELVDGEYIRF